MAFLQARIDGAGADAVRRRQPESDLRWPPSGSNPDGPPPVRHQLPGQPYERSAVRPPRRSLPGRHGDHAGPRSELFAADDATVVEQRFSLERDAAGSPARRATASSRPPRTGRGRDRVRRTASSTASSPTAPTSRSPRARTGSAPVRPASPSTASSPSDGAPRRVAVFLADPPAHRAWTARRRPVPGRRRGRSLQRDPVRDPDVSTPPTPVSGHRRGDRPALPDGRRSSAPEAGRLLGTRCSRMPPSTVGVGSGAPITLLDLPAGSRAPGSWPSRPSPTTTASRP